MAKFFKRRKEVARVLYVKSEKKVYKGENPTRPSRLIFFDQILWYILESSKNVKRERHTVRRPPQLAYKLNTTK